MPKRKEEAVRAPETRAERELRLMREAVRRSDVLYRVFLETLSPRDRERLPEP